MKAPKAMVGAPSSLRKQLAHSAVVNNPTNRKNQIEREYYKFQEFGGRTGFTEAYGLCARSSASWALYFLGEQGHFGEVAALSTLTSSQALRLAHSISKLHTCLEDFQEPKKINKVPFLPMYTR